MAQALITEVEVWLRVVAHKGGLAMTRKCSRALVLLLVVIVPVMLLGAGSVSADEDQRGAVQLLRVIPATDCPTCAHDTIAVFDISWVDQATRRYYLADRTNNAIDVVDTKNNVYLTQLLKGQFKGFTGSNDTSGPNGVVVSGRWLFVTDAPSKVHSIDLTNPVMFADTLDIPGADNGNRTDELAYDSRDGILLVVNNADDPPFATLVHVNTTNGHLTLGQKITFANWTGQDGHHTKATNGAEQPVWNPHTGRFYISIPEVDGPGGGRGELGALGVINPFTGTLETSFPVRRCQPAGLTVGPHNDLLIGCSETFTANNGPRWNPASPTPNPTPKQVIMRARTGDTTDVPGVGGSDEVWFNNGLYYTASRNNPEGPVLGVIDAESKKLIQVVPTVAPGAAGGTAHSVAVDSHNNHAFVPLPANNRINGCANGCIAVYGVPNGEASEDD